MKYKRITALFWTLTFLFQMTLFDTVNASEYTDWLEDALFIDIDTDYYNKSGVVLAEMNDELYLVSTSMTITEFTTAYSHRTFTSDDLYDAIYNLIRDDNYHAY